MEPTDYLTQFAAVDTDEDGIITRRQLFKYALNIQDDISMVNTWFKLFDAEDKGAITIEDVSRILGVPPPKYYKDPMRRKTKDGFVDHSKSTPDLYVGIEEARLYDDSSRRPVRWKSQDEKYEDGEWLKRKAQLEERNVIDLEDIAKEIENILESGARRHLQDSLIAVEIAQMLEKQCGPCWHVHVSRKTLGCAVSHCPGKMIQLKSQGLIVAAHQTAKNEF
ncbi:unnamed protein product [Dicrocoelium dendriticum]|nr:unnamed protein product [Dicrocoelium dendriticum]